MAEKQIEQAVILAGGLGARLRPLTNDRPKPMVEVNGKPFLEHLLLQLKAQGIQRVLLLTGYLHQVIEDYFADGACIGMEVSYCHGAVEWDTGRRLFRARPWLDPHFFLLYADNYLNYRLTDLVKAYQAQSAPVSLVVVPKEGGNIRLDERSVVTLYDQSRRATGLNYVELGFMCVDRQVIDAIDDETNPSFTATLTRLAQQQNIVAYRVFDQYYSISDPQRLALTAHYLQPKKLVLLDRDGTLNVKAKQGHYITDTAEFVLIQKHIMALKKLAAAGFEFLVVTNQAGLATGDLSQSALCDIHDKLHQELAIEGITLRQIYVAGAHWQDQADWDRKPNPGLFFRLSREHALCLGQTWYIGDDPRDMQAARNAGCRGLFLGDVAQLSTELNDFVDLASVDMAMLTEHICKEFGDENISDR